METKWVPFEMNIGGWRSFGKVFRMSNIASNLQGQGRSRTKSLGALDHCEVHHPRHLWLCVHLEASPVD